MTFQDRNNQQSDRQESATIYDSVEVINISTVGEVNKTERSKAFVHFEIFRSNEKQGKQIFKLKDDTGRRKYSSDAYFQKYFPTYTN